ncbi:MAG: type II toxin-antitoxin system VapC family toxin [Acidobacteriota bacterium]|nr:type II toxin-antitoxin system VapC family toxin [Acidobacteriota bacterium]
MDNYFFDSSALAKRYLIEDGSLWVETTTGNLAHNIFVANITVVEVSSALARRVRNGKLPATDAASANSALSTDFAVQYLVNDISPTVISIAVNLTTNHGLRGYDAVQLAVALDVNKNNLAFNVPPIIFVSADNDLNNAARAEGLSVENPNNYP